MLYFSVCKMGILCSGKLPEKSSVKRDVCNVGSLGEMKSKLREGDKRGMFFYSRDAGLTPGMTRVKEELSWKDSAAQSRATRKQFWTIPEGLIQEPKGCFRVSRKLRHRNTSRIYCFSSSVFFPCN